MAEKMESMIVKKDELAKIVADLEARLKESKPRMKESELQASKEREANKELEDQLLVYKKEAMEQHEKGFHKTVRQAEFFAKDLDLGLFDPFKDMKDNVLLDEEDIAVEEKDAHEEQGAEEQGDNAKF